MDYSQIIAVMIANRRISDDRRDYLAGPSDESAPDHSEAAPVARANIFRWFRGFRRAPAASKGTD